MTALLAGAAVGLARLSRLPLRLGRASSFMEGNQPAAAIAQLEKMVKQRPDFLPAHFDLAQAYFNQSEYRRRRQSLNACWISNPSTPGARALLGMVYLNQNRPQTRRICSPSC